VNVEVFEEGRRSISDRQYHSLWWQCPRIYSFKECCEWILQNLWVLIYPQMIC